MSANNSFEPWQKKLANIASACGVEIKALTVTENGTYSEEGKAYSPVTVNVSGGGGSTEYTIRCYSLQNEPIESHLYPAIYSAEIYNWIKDPSYTGAALTSATAGSALIWDVDQEVIQGWYIDIDDENSDYYGVVQPVMITPAKNIDIITGRIL